MVGQLVWLKWRLLRNGLRADRQRRIGLPLVLALLLWGGQELVVRYRAAAAGLSEAAAGDLAIWAAVAVWLGWVALPVVLFPLDETLDPSRFALLPASRRSLVIGLGLAGLVTPTVLLPLRLLAVDVGQFGGGLALPVVVLGCLVLLSLLIVAGHLFSATLTAILRSRRGRDLALFVVSGIGLAGFGAQQLVSSVVGELGLEGAVTAYSLAPWSVLVPPAAAQTAIVAAASGDLTRSAINLAAAAGWLVLLAIAWERVIAHLVVTPEASARPLRAARRRGLVASGRGWSAFGVVARKELRMFIRDPRMRMVWTGAAIFIGAIAAALVVGTEQVDRLRQSSWLPLLSPAFVLFVGLPIALNQFGWERNAASYVFALPIKPRQLIVGKNAATAIGLLIESLAVSLLLAATSNGWEVMPLVPALCIAAIGCQLAVGNLVSVLTPLRLPEVGTDIFAQASEQGCLAIGSQLVSFFAIGLLMVPPASVMVLTVAFGSPIGPVFAVPFAVIWGGAFYLLSVWLSGMLLRRRVPEVVAWVQTI